MKYGVSYAHLGDVGGPLVRCEGPLSQLQLLQVDALDQLLPLLPPLPARQ